MPRLVVHGSLLGTAGLSFSPASPGVRVAAKRGQAISRTIARCDPGGSGRPRTALRWQVETGRLRTAGGRDFVPEASACEYDGSELRARYKHERLHDRDWARHHEGSDRRGESGALLVPFSR